MERDTQSASEYGAVFEDHYHQQRMISEFNNVDRTSILEDVLSNRSLPNFDPAGFVLEYFKVSLPKSNVSNLEFGVYFARRMLLSALTPQQEQPCFNIFDSNLIDESNYLLDRRIVHDFKLDEFCEDLFSRIYPQEFEPNNSPVGLEWFKNGFMAYVGIVELVTN